MFTNISSIQKVIYGSLISDDSELEYLFGWDTDKNKLLWLKRAGQEFTRIDDEWLDATSYLAGSFGRGNVVHTTPSTSVSVPFTPQNVSTKHTVKEGTFVSLDGLTDVSGDVNRTHLSQEELDEVQQIDPEWEPRPAPAFNKTVANDTMGIMGAPPADVSYVNPEELGEDSDGPPDMTAFLNNPDAIPEAPEYQEKDFLDPKFVGTAGLDGNVQGE